MIDSNQSLKCLLNLVCYSYDALSDYLPLLLILVPLVKFFGFFSSWSHLWRSVHPRVFSESFCIIFKAFVNLGTSVLGSRLQEDGYLSKEECCHGGGT